MPDILLSTVSFQIYVLRLVCTGVNCGAPPLLEHGQYHGEDFYAGTSVEYQCNSGFYLLGESKMQCANNGKWTGNPPACLGKHD